MNTIKLSNYNSYLGELIYLDKNIMSTINLPGKYIPYDELLFNHKKYLTKNNSYYLICSGGIKSKKATNILSLYGYNVTNVIK